MKARTFKNIAVGKPAKLVDSIDYTNDGIGRNLLLGNKRVSFIEFAFSEEKGLVTPEAQGDVMVYVLEGQLEVELDGKDYSVEDGEFMILPQGMPHCIESDHKTKILFILAHEDVEEETQEHICDRAVEHESK